MHLTIHRKPIKQLRCIGIEMLYHFIFQRMQPIKWTEGQEVYEALSQGNVEINNIQEVEKIMIEIITITATGRFPNSPSPITVLLPQFWKKLVSFSKLTVFDLIDKYGIDFSIEQYLNLIKSYLPLGMKSQSSKRELSQSYIEALRIYEVHMAEREAKRYTLKITVDLTLPFSQRFEKYIKEGNLISFQKYFGSKMTDEEKQNFISLFKDLSKDLQYKIIDIFKKHQKHPYFKRLGKQLEIAFSK